MAIILAEAKFINPVKGSWAKLSLVKSRGDKTHNDLRMQGKSSAGTEFDVRWPIAMIKDRDAESNAAYLFHTLTGEYAKMPGDLLDIRRAIKNIINEGSL